MDEIGGRIEGNPGFVLPTFFIVQGDPIMMVFTLISANIALSKFRISPMPSFSYSFNFRRSKGINLF